MTNIFEDLVDCRRILRELHILRATRGMKGVVQLFEIIRPADLDTFKDIYVVLEYAPCDLKKLLKQKRSHTLANVRQIMLSLLIGLNNFHKS